MYILILHVMDFKKLYIDLKASNSLQTSKWVITLEYMKTKTYNK